MAPARRSVCEDEDEYDVDAVAVQLARMQQRRDARRASRARPEAPLSERLRSADACATAEFELNAAELSAGSDSESADEGSANTNSLSSDDAQTERSTGKRPHEAASRTRKARLADSLDLSISVAELPRPLSPLKQNKPAKEKLSNVPSSASTAPLKRSPHDASDYKRAPLDKTEHHSSENDGGSDLWTSKLVQRRRMLEKAAAVSKEDSAVVKTGSQLQSAPAYRPRDEPPSLAPTSAGHGAAINASHPNANSNSVA